MVEPTPEGDESGDMKISIIKPEKQPTPVGVGGRKDGDETEEGVDDHGALDQPAVEQPPVDE
jgi:ATP-dependent Clp protease ATP-binding subunit ClpC